MQHVRVPCCRRGARKTRDGAFCLAEGAVNYQSAHHERLPRVQLGRVLINRQPNANLDGPPTSVVGSKADMARTCPYVR